MVCSCVHIYNHDDLMIIPSRVVSRLPSLVAEMKEIAFLPLLPLGRSLASQSIHSNGDHDNKTDEEPSGSSFFISAPFASIPDLDGARSSFAVGFIINS